MNSDGRTPLNQDEPESLRALRAALEFFDNNQNAFAAAIGEKQGTVWNWLNKTKKCPVEKAAEIERATSGKVTRQELRPDIPWIVLQDAPEGFELKEGDQVIRLEGGQWVRVLR